MEIRILDSVLGMIFILFIQFSWADWIEYDTENMDIAQYKHKRLVSNVKSEKL